MQTPLKIAFVGLDTLPATEAAIRRHVAQLERMHDRITGCKVVVEQRHHHHKQGNAYRVLVDLTLPGAEVVVARAPDQDRAHEDIDIAVRDAFQAATRQLAGALRRRSERRRQH